jgi:pimeloyl-ACP methyl ester carboxylesterase
MATFVLVPGAWCGGWVFRHLAPYLCDAGHEVYTPTVTGLGERVHLASPDVTLDTHITDIVNVLAYEDLHDAVLVGWSYGGTIITGVADRVPDRIAQLIYLDARVPEDGQTDYDLEPGGEAYLAEDAESAAAAGTPGFAPIPMEGARAHITHETLQAWVLDRLTPHPLATWTQPIRLGNPAAEAIPRAFIFCTEDRDPGMPDPRYLARVRTDPAWRYRELIANHSAPITKPRETAATLLKLVEGDILPAAAEARQGLAGEDHLAAGDARELR